jgi:fructuronate reductase
VPIRAVPVIRAGGDPGATRLVAAWIAHLRGHGAPVTDVRSDVVIALASGPAAAAVAKVLAWLGLDDAGADVEATVGKQLAELESVNGPSGGDRSIAAR